MRVPFAGLVVVALAWAFEALAGGGAGTVLGHFASKPGNPYRPAVSAIAGGVVSFMNRYDFSFLNTCCATTVSTKPSRTSVRTISGNASPSAPRLNSI